MDKIDPSIKKQAQFMDRFLGGPSEKRIVNISFIIYLYVFYSLLFFIQFLFIGI